MILFSVLCFIFIPFVFGRDSFTVEFIKQFIDNEEKPSILIFLGLCWGKHLEVKLMSEMSKAGVRSSSIARDKSEVLDLDLFLADLECPGADDVLNDAASKRLFQFPLRWLVLANSERVNITNSAIWGSPILVTSDLVLAERNGDFFVMNELHRPSANHTVLHTPRGYYNGTLVDTRPHREMYRRRRDFMGEPLTMANVIQDSNVSKVHLLKEDRLDLQNDAVPKACWVAAKLCFEMLNATGKYIFSYRFGYKVNGEWSGMISDINSNKADFATNCIMFMDRLDVVTYTDLVAPLRMRFIYRQPPLTYTSNIFSLPFSTDVWVALVVCSVVTMMAFLVTSMWEVQMERNPTQLDGSISDAFLLTMSAVAQQGCFLEPRRAPGRIIEWFLFAALMALYAAYSANIVVLLQAPSNSIRTLAQLAASKITLAALDVDYNRFVFKAYNDSTHVTISERVLPEGAPPNFYHIDEGVEKIRQGLFAFHAVTEPVYRRIEDTFHEMEKCDLSEADFVNGFDGFIPVKKDSPFLEMIRVTYKQIRETGMQDAIAKRFLVSQPRCVTRVAAFSSVGLLDMKPVLIFMVYGVVFSVMIFFAEVVFYKLTIEVKAWKNKTKNQRTTDCWK